MDNLDLNHVAVFAAVAEAGSFIGAARRLDLPRSTVSRRLQLLEERLGVRLLDRTTRSLTLTDAGQHFLAGVQPALEALRDAAAATSDAQLEPQGRLRMTTGVGLANYVFAGLLAEFVQRHPRVTLDLELTDRKVDLIGEGFDIAIRAGPLEDTSMIQRKLGVSRNLLVASPAFLERHPPLRVPQDLQSVPVLLQPGQETWRLEGPDGSLQLPMSGPIRVNNIAMLHTAALTGVGIARIPYFICRESLAEGRLVRVLPEWEPRGYPVHVLLPSRRHPSSAVRSFLALIERHLPTLFAA